MAPLARSRCIADCRNNPRQALCDRAATQVCTYHNALETGLAGCPGGRSRAERFRASTAALEAPLAAPIWTRPTVVDAYPTENI